MVQQPGELDQGGEDAALGVELRQRARIGVVGELVQQNPQRDAMLDLVEGKALVEQACEAGAAGRAILDKAAQEVGADMEATHPTDLAAPLARGDLDLAADAEQGRHADAGMPGSGRGHNDRCWRPIDQEGRMSRRSIAGTVHVRISSRSQSSASARAGRILRAGRPPHDARHDGLLRLRH
ncbi:hypothetical protein OIU35_28470 [Boseaceae bacterium BT-24-1]|nr:hypothetical protein [Boseaceae bacterium BT-24-1]